MRFTALQLILLFALLTSLVGTAAAQIYKWTDAQGNVHYGDCPPADCKTEQIEAPQSPSQEDVQSATKRSQQLIQEQAARDQQRRIEREIAQKEYRQKQLETRQKCKTMRSQLVLLEQRGIVTFIDPAGNLLRPTDEVRAQMITDIKVFLDKHCQ